MMCHICKTAVDDSLLHYDHVVPLARGGAHTNENIAVSHAVCNIRKSDKLVSELEVQS